MIAVNSPLLSHEKKKNLKIKKEINEKFKIMIEVFDQNYFSGLRKGIYIIRESDKVLWE